MSRISSSVIEDIKRLNIVNIISPFVTLNQKGRSTLGLCPFHSEKTPSFHVNEEKGFYKCFGCNEAGDAITFVMKYKNFDYVDAITYICENFGVEIRFEEGTANQKPIKELKLLHEKFADLSQGMLYKAEGKKALEYLLRRDFTEDILKDFGLGFVPYSFDVDSFLKEFSKDCISSSGIFFYQQGGWKTFFANRILFPIRSATGACVGFSGRTMDPNEKAKYKNSPETAIFSKRRELYNLHKAKEHMSTSKSCFIVEGYFDVMRMSTNGYPNTVAIMGTAFTKEQVAQLKKYAEEYNLLLDGDEAGQKAMRDSRTVAIDTNIYPNVIFLPAGEDPDTFIKGKGVGELSVLLDKKEDLLMYTISEERLKGVDTNRKFHRLDNVKKMLEMIKDPYRRDFYTKKTAEAFEVDLSQLGIDVAPQQKTVIREYRSKNVPMACEKDFLCSIMLLPDESVMKLFEDIEEEYFENEESQFIFKKVVELLNESGSISGLLYDPTMESFRDARLIRDIQHLTNDKNNSYITAIMNKNQILLNYHNKRRIALTNELVKAHEDDKPVLLEEWQKVMKSLQQIKSDSKLLNEE